MLNKLLKRCMPWMDKGRWYTLTLVKTNSRYGIDPDKTDDDLPLSYANVSGSELYIGLASSGNVAFIVKDLRIALNGSNLLYNNVGYANVPYLSAVLKEGDATESSITCYNAGSFAEEYETMQILMYAEKVTV